MRVFNRLFFSVSLIFGLVNGCNQKLPESVSEPTANRTTEPAAPESNQSQNTAVPQKSIRTNAVSGSNFELIARPADSYPIGKKAAFTISLKPRGEYHINQKFPTSVTTQVPKSIALEKPQLAKTDSALFTEQQVKFEVEFTASEAGEHEVKSLVSFAVCTSKTCIPLRENLTVLLKVK